MWWDSWLGITIVTIGVSVAAFGVLLMIELIAEWIND
jgi:hypothetical protein